MKEYKETEEKTEKNAGEILSQKDLDVIEKNLGQMVELQMEELQTDEPEEFPEDHSADREDSAEEEDFTEEEEPAEGEESAMGEASAEEKSISDDGESSEEEEGMEESQKEELPDPNPKSGSEEKSSEEEPELTAAITSESASRQPSRHRRRASGTPKPRRSRETAQRRKPEKARVPFSKRMAAGGRLLLRFFRSRWFRHIAVLLAVLFVVLFTAHTVRNWTYHSYEISEADNQTDTTSFNYCALGDYVLRYGLDSAMLTSRNGQTVWSVTYSMQSPALAVCGNTAAIYDKSGTTIVVCDETGQIGTVSTTLPIQKAEVAEQGVVAAILEDGDSTWIQYFDQQGEMIASFRTAMDATGYPMDLSLSSNGMLLGVSYLKMENGVPKTELNFYNFGNAGQIQMDNQVSSYTYENTLIPDVTFLDSNTCVAFLENGFAVFEGGQIPEKVNEVIVEQEIVSVFWDDSHIGMILDNDSEDYPFLLALYGPSGREIFQKELDFEYQNVEMGFGQILLTNRTGFCVYSTDGVEKFRGELSNVIVQDLFALGRTRFMLVAEDGLYTIRIK